ncbi:MAG: substrate-binding domain-containing protein [Epulopiscium sp.]|jgi:ribose transport system substrate-binding protein|nr:substrate-binding domain-containing protein [Candidatus Epulonipiscium sp.]
MKRNSNVLIILALAFCTAFLALFLRMDSKENKPKGYVKISVISRDTTGDTMETLRQGMEQAASDMRAEISFITLSKRNDAQEQIRLIQREVLNGTDAILLSAADSEELSYIAEEVSKEIPIYTVESPVASDKVPQSAESKDWSMGRLLGENLIYRGVFGKKILILESSMRCHNIVEREKGLLDAITGGRGEIITAAIGKTEDFKAELTEVVQIYEPDIVVALEPYTLNAAAEALQEKKYGSPKLYGICTTSKTSQYMEEGLIEGIVVQNDFNAGYLSVYQVMKALKKTDATIDGEIEFALIHSYNMYSSQNQRLLFPFVR